MKQWLVIDAPFMCHRAFHSSRDLTHNGRSTSAIFGFLMSLGQLKDEFHTEHMAFCFDHDRLFRRDILPGYKLKRRTKERTPEEQEQRKQLGVQIKELEKRWLPMIGFKNVFSYRGMEADDIMATIARERRAAGEGVVIVTADNDLLQCIRHTTSVHNPISSKTFTREWFVREHGIKPAEWAIVKALAGCSSDEVPGIRGVGEKTALKYLRGELNSDSMIANRINSYEGKSIKMRNKPLVLLPHSNCPIPKLQTDNVTREGWEQVCSDLGMKSLISRLPISIRKRSVKKP